MTLPVCHIGTAIDLKIFLSIRLAGSMDVERIAKQPLKHQILTKERNMLLGDKKATVLLRASEKNLKFLFEAKQALWAAAIHDSKVAGGVVVVD